MSSHYFLLPLAGILSPLPNPPMETQSILLTLCAGAIVSIATQFLKRYVPNISALAVAACISILGGIGYALLASQGLLEVFMKHSTVAFTGAVAIYEILKVSVGNRQ